MHWFGPLIDIREFNENGQDLYIKNETAYAEYIIKNAINDDVLEFPYFFYPGYEVTIETSEKCTNLKIEESENGFVQITIPENIESGKINFCYKGTNIEKVSYIISAISLIGFIIYIIYYKKKEA